MLLRLGALGARFVGVEYLVVFHAVGDATGCAHQVRVSLAAAATRVVASVAIRLKIDHNQR